MSGKRLPEIDISNINDNRYCRFFLPRLTLAVTFHDWPHTSHYTQYRDDGTISIRVEKKETIFNDDKKASSTHPRFEYACPFTSIRGFIKSLSLKRGEGKKEFVSSIWSRREDDIDRIDKGEQACNFPRLHNWQTLGQPRAIKPERTNVIS